ncbi:MAG TPA: mercuric reductase, partial [Blastocatellia bacterium]|nr:mercuric reductase [Blastocatellia bacterium]
MPNPIDFDAIVIGTGQGGKPLAVALAAAGWETAVVERLHVGGTCVNVGCTPTKTMVASARVAYLARRSADYGIHAENLTVNLSEIRHRKQTVVDSFRNGGQSSLERAENLELIFGEASFTSAYTVGIKLNDGRTRELRAPKIFINVGCRPADPGIAGSEHVPILDSSSIMELDELPEHLLVLGGGYIGLEFGQMFRRFGSRVTIVQRAAQLLGREDQDVADEVAKILSEDGIEVLLNTSAMKLERGDEGKIHLTVKTAEGEHTIIGSHLLAAAGRTPNSDALNLAAAGVETDKAGFIKTNAKLETNVAGIYALGDVKGGPQFTHISYDDYRIVKTNLLEGGNATITDRFVPYTVFIDPQLARVGVSESEAKAKGLNVKIAKMPMAYVARAIEMSETRGFMKAV